MEEQGVQIVNDVTPFEQMKLRLLNASHSALAYRGFLRGETYVYEAITGDTFIKEMMEEIIPTLSSDVTTLRAYCDALIDRFKNPNIQHSLYQIAMDGSQKIPQRILSTIQACIQSDKPFGRLTQVVVAWMYYTRGIDAYGDAFTVRDQLAEKMAAIHKEAFENVDYLVDGYLQLPGIFSDFFKTSSLFRRALSKAVMERSGNRLQCSP